jgi:DNA replication protein DnaC
VADEPRKVPRKCKKCNEDTFAVVYQIRDARTGGYRGVALGGEYCERCWAAIEAAERIQDWQEAHAKHLEGANLPQGLREIQFDGFTQAEAVDLAKRWSAGQIQGLCLTGSVGVGKTWLAAAAVWQMLYRRRVRWVDTAQLVSSLRASFDDESRAKALRVITGSGPAVFDDLDKVNPSDFVREVIYGAINARVAAGSPLLITTNKPISGLGQIFGKPIASRLASYCEVVEMVGVDRRLHSPTGSAA